MAKKQKTKKHAKHAVKTGSGKSVVHKILHTLGLHK